MADGTEEETSDSTLTPSCKTAPMPMNASSSTVTPLEHSSMAHCDPAAYRGAYLAALWRRTQGAHKHAVLEVGVISN